MKKLNNLINAFANLPGIGRKLAMRISFDMLDKDENYINDFIFKIKDAYENIHSCKICGNFCENDICEICSNDKRNRNIICVVESVRDILAIEKSNTFNGLYHVLGGKIDPLNGVTIEDLNINSLLSRIDENLKKVNDVDLNAVETTKYEIIFALNPDIEGETTILYLTKLLKNKNVKITRIASGIPMGGNIEYTDMATLGRSLDDRITIE